MKNEFKTGALNKITDVPGVYVGHKTVDNGNVHSGVTVIIPSEENIFQNKLAAASYVLNGFGKTAGLIQIDELGTLESPIALTNTLSVGTVLDALTQRAVRESIKLGKPLRSVNSVVCECNDARISDICAFGITKEHVEEAFDNVCKDFEEGDVGAGRGMVCHGLKGGIGSASRIVKFDGKEYTVGIILLTNHGSLRDLTVDGKPIGKEILDGINESDKGSIIVVMATDIPLSPRQIKRAIKRVATALARVGSRIGHGSGEVFIGFSTANVTKEDEQNEIVTYSQLAESKIDKLFRAVSEASEDALLKSMLYAEAAVSTQGKPIHSLSEYVKDR